MKPQAIIIAQPTYDGEKWSSLPQAADAAKLLATDLGSHGYEVNRALLSGGEAVSTLKIFKDWVESRPAKSCLIIIWTGHGYLEDADYYLICKDSPKHGLVGTNAIDVAEFAKILLPSRADRALIILDTCHSGRGVSELASELAKRLDAKAPGRKFWGSVIASAHATEKAKEGIFLGALHQALFAENLPSEKREWNDNENFIRGDDLGAACMSLMSEMVSEPIHQAFGFARKFICNPRYQGGLPAENVEERAWRLSRSDAAKPFTLAAKGIEVGEQGWFFTGRKRLQDELVAWLKRPEEGGLRIVTGPPGSGKSAVIGRLVVLSEEGYRRQAIKEGGVKEDDFSLPPSGVIKLAIYTKGKTLDECARALAKALELTVEQGAVTDAHQLVERVAKLGGPLTLVFDALDEAANGYSHAIARELIVPLAGIPQIKVLVGCRYSLDGVVVPMGEDRHCFLRAAFGSQENIRDLEDEADSEEDIIEYVYRRLRSAKSLEMTEDELTNAARHVAEAAQGVFLYARIVSRTIRERSSLIGVLPKDALEAFEQDLDARFTGERRRVDDLLGALAWGEGQGLTRRAWAPVARAVTPEGATYSDEDVGWVLSHAGWHIVEASEGGQAVYRLAHQTLADHYRCRHDAVQMHGRIVAALRAGVEGEGWLACDHYLWRYLADHAAKAGCLDELICDPGYLAVADPSRLLQTMGSIKGAKARRTAAIYGRVVDRLVGRDPLERMPLIHLVAQMEDAELAAALVPPTPVAWRCRWARVRTTASHRIIARQNNNIGAVAFGNVDGQPMIASLDRSAALKLWDPLNGKLLGKPLPVDKPFHDIYTQSEVQSVAFGLLDGKPVIVSTSGRQIGLCDVRTQRWIYPPSFLSGSKAPLAVETMNNRPVTLVGAMGSEMIRLYDAVGQTAEFQKVGTLVRIRGGLGCISAIGLGSWHGQPVAAVARTSGFVRIFNPKTGKNIRRPLFINFFRCPGIAVGMMGHRPVVAWGGLNGEILLVDGFTGRKIGRPLVGHGSWTSAITFGVFNGQFILVSGGSDGTLRLWDLETEVDRAQPSQSLHKEAVSSVAVTTTKNRTVAASGSYDKTVRLWEGETGRQIQIIRQGVVRKVVEWLAAFRHEIKTTDKRRGYVVAVALGEVEGRLMVVTGQDDHTIRRWDARTGRQVGKPLVGHVLLVPSVAMGPVNGRMIIASGSHDGTVGLWDAGTGHPMFWDEGTKRPMFWDTVIGRLTTSAPLDESEQFYHTRAHGGQVHAVALGKLDDRAIAVCGGFPNTVEQWDTATGEPMGDKLEAGDSWVNALAVGQMAGGLVIAAGNEDHKIRLWTAGTHTLIGEPLTGHSAGVTAVALCEVDGRSLVVSASWDNTIRWWEVGSGGMIDCGVIPIQEQVTSLVSDGCGGVVVGLDRGLMVIDLTTR